MNSYKQIADHYNSCFEKHGATPKGLDWDNQENLNKRYQVMLGLLPQERDEYPTMLDFGCGYGGIYEYIQNRRRDITYVGLDINKKLLEQAYNSYPDQTWHLLDIHNQEFEFSQLPNFDYVICNGTFTVKHTLTQNEMWKFMTESLEKLWTKTNKGIAFNCMSKILDYEREDLFHVSFDELSMWIYKYLSSKFTIRQDYGLREFTMYVYK